MSSAQSYCSAFNLQTQSIREALQKAEAFHQRFTATGVKEAGFDDVFSQAKDGMANFQKEYQERTLDLLTSWMATFVPSEVEDMSLRDYVAKTMKFEDSGRVTMDTPSAGNFVEVKHLPAIIRRLDSGLRFRFPSPTNIDFLEEVKGVFQISANVQSLQRLKRVGGNLSIEAGNPLNSFPSLEYVGGSFRDDRDREGGRPVLVLPKLKEIYQEAQFQNLTSLECPKLEQVGHLYLNNTTVQRPFSSLKSVWYSMDLQGTNITDFRQTFPVLERIVTGVFLDSDSMALGQQIRDLENRGELKSVGKIQVGVGEDVQLI